MTARRLLAALGAVALIAAALIVRAVVFDDGDDGGGGSPAASRTAVCASELAAACEEAGFDEVTVEQPGVTADRLTGGERLGADVWVTTTPWPAMVEAAQGSTRIGPIGSPIASGNLLLVTSNPRFDALDRRCSPFSWRCVGDLVDTPWADLTSPEQGTVAIGVDSVDSSAGLATVGGLVAGYFEALDIPTAGLATNDFDDAFNEWLERVARSSDVRSTGPGSVLERFVRLPAGGSTVTGLEVDVSRGVVGAAAERFAHAPPGPLVTTHAVVVGEVSEDVRNALGESLRASGWAPPTASTADAATGLPNSGVMVALRDRWRQLTR